MTYYEIKETFKEIGVIVILVTIILGPITLLLISSARHNSKIEKINKKYDQKLSDIRECKTIECVNKVLEVENAVN